MPITPLHSILVAAALAQSPETPSISTSMKAEMGSPLPMPNQGTPQKGPMTDAEKIANARDSIKQATLAIEKIEKRLADPEGEYHKAEADFAALNSMLKNLKAMAAKLRMEGKTKEAESIEATLTGIQENWQLAKDRFDIAIRQKKASQDSITGLKERIVADQKLLDRLEGNEKPAPKTDPSVPPVPAQPGNPTSPEKTVPVTPNPAPPATGPAPTAPTPAPPTATAQPEAKPAGNLAITPAGLLPGVPESPKATNPHPAHPETPAPSPAANDPIVLQTQEKLETQRAELQEVEERVRGAQEQVRVVERSIRSAQKNLQLEQESIAQSEKEVAKWSETLCVQPELPESERDELLAKLTETEKRLTESRDRIQRISARIAEFNEKLVGLKEEAEVVVKEADKKREAIAATEAELVSLLSPTAPRNMFRWVLTKGPRLIFIVVGVLLLHLACRQFSRHIVRFITRNSQRGSTEDRENRASTLVGVFRYATGLVVFGGGLVMILDEVGVPVVPLMGGAAVIGLAVAFGAQNLIRDYFTGFMMLMEDQYSVNDVVRIGSIAGLVEQITLRVTVLRDLEGTRHFIPHGTITSVSNLTHGWSRAMLDIPVAYRENVDRVIEELIQLGKELRLDPKLGKHIIEDPEMLGVDELAASGVVIKFLMKTRPLQQWPVKRELLRRIKNRFDELGIEIPLPHRTIYHRFPEGEHGNGVLRIESDRSVA